MPANFAQMCTMYSSHHVFSNTPSLVTNKVRQKRKINVLASAQQKYNTFDVVERLLDADGVCVCVYL